jgi:hypothetical protein
VVLVLLSLVTVILSAYTLRFQRSTLILGKRIAEDNPFMPMGFQDAITPKAQTQRSIIAFILFLITAVYCFIFYPWYIAIILILSILILIPIVMAFMPSPESAFFKKRITQDLLKRKSQYVKVGDTERKKAVDFILEKFETLS